ncbi:hypothetical protein OH77DRAFT_963052 [Trametes cingulata]|nr:hypothetical protein OH77DRAFT_963052 [Trametes cingulata]
MLPKSESPDLSPIPEFERDDVYWLPKGDIIVTARGVGFKFNSTVLSRHSSVFQDLFYRAKAVATSQSVLHCPVVRLDDSAQAFRCVLDFLMTQREVAEERSTDPFELAYWQIRMSLKYRIHPLFVAATERLERLRLTDEFLLYCASVNLQPSPVNVKHAIIGLNLVRMVRRPSLLPTALIACAQFTPEELVKPVTLSDGTRLSLPKEDLAHCLEAPRILRDATVDVALRVFALPASAQCTRRDSGLCEEGLRRLSFRRLDDNLKPQPLGKQPFRLWSIDLARLPDPYRLCSRCADMVQEREREIMRAKWAELPCLLDVVAPGWPGSTCSRHCVNPSDSNVCEFDMDAEGESDPEDSEPPTPSEDSRFDD